MRRRCPRRGPREAGRGVDAEVRVRPADDVADPADAAVGKTFTWTFVGPTEADVATGKLSSATPTALTIGGRTVNADLSKVTQFGHDKLTVFGIGNDLNEKQWRAVIRQPASKPSASATHIEMLWVRKMIVRRL